MNCKKNKTVKPKVKTYKRRHSRRVNIPPPPPPLFANPNKQEQSIEPQWNNLRNPLPFSQRTHRDTTSCFYCKKQGHWSTHCPEKQKTLINKETTTTTTTTLSSGGATMITIPEDMQCPCGGGICHILTSKTEKNPGRQFYKCPRSRSACGFFQWCDERSSDQGVGALVSPYPMCSCGAGPCNRLKVMKEGQNKGRFFFVCTVTKGQGACNFFQWEDETKHSPQSTLAVQESPEMAKKTVKQGVYGLYGNESKESFSPGSVVRGSESPLTEEYPVKEVKEVGKSNSVGVYEKILSPMRNLRASEESNTSPFAKPGQWMKECFKCGETGHWMKDCTV